MLELELDALATHLFERRSVILSAWSRAAHADPTLTTAETLSRAQFYDHIPNMLDALERRLRFPRPADGHEATREETSNARNHGLQRWQQGYNEQEVMREWVWLNACLADELEAYASVHREMSAEVMSAAWRLTSDLLVTGLSESVAQYAHLQKAEAATRLVALEEAHQQLKALEQQRAEAWREATHDLRGNVSIMRNVATVLQRSGPSDSPPQGPLQILERGVASLTALLNDLTTQARLDAGRERRTVEVFDAARELTELCAHAQPLAAKHSLYLIVAGPSSLSAEGDCVKVRRIAQNLLLNALQYTAQGGVKVSWEEALDAPPRWMLCVQDTGPGLGTRVDAPLSVALDEATRDQQQLKDDAGGGQACGDETAPAPTLASRTARDADQAGEGIGLAIVKRLCELLDATLELHTEPGRGTTFRVTFPTVYPKG